MYIGKGKIKSHIKLENGHIEYQLEDGFKDTMTEKQFNDACSEEIGEDSATAHRMFKSTIGEILTTLVDDEIKLGEIDYILTRVKQSLADSEDQVFRKVFDVKYKEDVSLKQIDDYIVKTKTK